jgi:hypothetical protein
LLTSLLRAGGEADAIGLLCFAQLVYQPQFRLSITFSKFFAAFFAYFSPLSYTLFAVRNVTKGGTIYAESEEQSEQP